MMIEHLTWRLHLPRHVSVLETEPDEDVATTLVFDNCGGVIQFSSYLAPRPLEIEDLNEFAFDEGDQGEVTPVSLGGFDGIALINTNAETTTHAYYLKNQATMLFVTYNVGSDEVAASAEQLRAVLEGLEPIHFQQ